MANAFHHAVSSARRFGGTPEDYLAIHELMDSSKNAWADQRHRVVLHTSFGISLVSRMIGLEEQVRVYEARVQWMPRWLKRLLRLPQISPTTIRLSNGRRVPIRFVTEQHCLEDFGFVPSLEQYMKGLPKEPWMSRGTTKLEITDKESTAHG